MATSRIATIELTCNTARAVKRLKEMETVAKQTLTSIQQKTQRLNQLQAKGSAVTKAEQKEIKTLTSEIKQLTGKFNDYNSAIARGLSSHVKLRNVMKDLSGSKLKDLKMAMRELQKMMQNVSNDTPKRTKVIQDAMARVQAQITRLTGETGKFGARHSSVWQTAVRNITAYVGVFGAFNFIRTKITEVIRLNNQLSDQMADIRKVSGLAMADIQQLTLNLSKIDTRTTLEELNKIAYAGAKLGFGSQGVEGLEAFTRAANQVNVALKEDLGDEALTALSKITENMGLVKKMGVENAMLATGSAMFKLAATSTAAAGPIVEVTKRIVPMAQQAGLATDEILALASSADSLQLMPEVVGTALSKLIGALQTNHNLIEKSFDLPSGMVENWMKQGKAMDVILTVFDKMKEKGNMSALGEDFKKLGGEGFRLISVLTAMANHVDRVRDHLEVSRTAFREATAVTEEYNIQQDTAQALMERASNMWRNAWVNPEASETVKDLARSWYDFTRNLLATPEAMRSINFFLNAIIFSLQTLIRLIPAIIAMSIVKGVQKLGAAMGFASIATNGFAAAWSRMSAAMKTNWIFLAVAALAELWYHIRGVNSAAAEAEAQQKKTTQALQEAKEKAEQDIDTLGRLKKQIDDANISQDERNRLLSKVTKDYDIYLNYLGVEIKTVDDLARHYDALTKVIRQRYAYEEREEYKRSTMASEGGSRMNRRMTGAALAKQYREETGNSLDMEALQGFIADAYKNGKVDMAKVKGFAGVNLKSKSRNDATALLIDFTNSVIKEIQEEQTIDAAFAPEIGDFDYDKYLRERVKGDFSIKPDKEALKAAKAAAAEQRRKEAQARRERLQQLRGELKDAEQEAQAIIDKINEFYYLQEETIESAVADGKITREIADKYLLDLKLSKNETLANARKTIAGKKPKAEWDDFVGKELGRIMVDQGEWSTELAGEITKTDLTYIHNLLARFNGSEAVLGLRSTASFDKLMKNAAVNERDNARIRSKIAEEVDKALMEYNYVEQAQKSFHGNLIALGIMRETYEQYAKRMQEEAKALAQKDAQSVGDVAWDLSLPGVSVQGKYKSPEQQLLQQFLSQGAKPYRVNPQSDRDLYVWLQNLMSNYDFDEEDNYRGHTESWVQKGFPQLEEWVKDIDKYRPEIQKFYFSLITWEDEYYDAKKKAYDRSKRLMNEEWERSGNKQRYDEIEWAMNRRGRERRMTGVNNGETFGQIGGFDALEEDPELALYRAKMEASQLYLQQLQQEHADEKLIREAQQAEAEAELQFQEQIMAKINERITKLQQWTEPVVQLGEQVGQALYDQWHNGESMGAKWQDMLKDLGMAWGKTTIKIVEELMMQRVKQRLLNRAMEADQMAHHATMTTIEETGGAAQIAAQAATNTIIETQEATHNASMLAEDTSAAAAENPVNTSRAAGKTLADLGWWGIPLVAVITTLLTTLLNAALGKSKHNSKNSSSNDASEKLKLVSGMLTYDEGNVSSYVGTDGHVYNARQSAIPQGTALVTSPIATTVNGQPSLVAERGPEIVIGRRTTRHIMLNEPGLLQHLAALDRRRATRYRPFDEGNLESLISASSGSAAAVSQSSSTDEQTRQTLEALTAAVLALQARLSQPIKAEINKYGTGGLIDEVQSGLKFMGKYNG